MKKVNISLIIRTAKAAISKHTPELLTGVGIAGMITTTVLAVRATPKAITLMEEKKEEERVDKLPPVKVMQTVWKCYIPAAVTGSLSIACLVGASSVNRRRQAALATAYKLTEAALTEYQEKVIETIGEKKEQVIRDKVAEEKIERNPVSKREVIITEKGNTLCYDAISGRYFKSDIDKIKKAENELNRTLMNDMYISLNEFYYELGLSRVSIGDDLGWNIDEGLIDLSFSSQLADDGTPCLVIDYHVMPRYNYKSFM